MDYESRKSVIILGVLGFASLLIMVTRLGMRKVRGQRFDISDYLTMGAITCLAARSSSATVIVLWGNNNLTPAYRASKQFDATEIYHREIGSKVTLCDRVFHSTYFWIQKSVVLILYQRMLGCLIWPHHIINFYWGFLAVTYVVVQIWTFVECTPFHLYWQVVPDPGHCTTGAIQLIVFVSLNMVTDAMLIGLPMPYLFRMRKPLKQRLSLVGLFSIGFMLLAIGFVRLPMNYTRNYNHSRTREANRTTLGSVEMFAAAVVANVPTLFALRPRHPTTHSTATSRSPHYTDTAGFRQVKDFDIITANNIELRDVQVEDVGELEEFREISNSRASNDTIHVIACKLQGNTLSSRINEKKRKIRKYEVSTDVRNTDTAGKGLVHTSLMFKLRTLGLDAFKLDGNLLGSDDFFSEVDLTEAAATDLTTDSVFVTDAKILEEEAFQHTGLSPNVEGKPILDEVKMEGATREAHGRDIARPQDSVLTPGSGIIRMLAANANRKKKDRGKGETAKMK
ncbi:hypothetical protein V495_02649 [Pseudogymnoascus sp. VKM F-4514 (FW-929)]|nr:hypothetical protein V495_02649 [Pseudogymnoascus sp. VKM F-4514 (FW-929)]KFY61129.1 hypothetical protein V497_03139 [Pseudogymnoascus sp. VKM F-4516 (FW-969)]